MGEQADMNTTGEAASAAAGIEARITGYFDACTSGDAAAVARHFTDDAVVYDTNHAPVRGAATIGRFWSRIASKWQGASWHCERLVTDGDTAAIEWRMSGTMPAPRSGTSSPTTHSDTGNPEAHSGGVPFAVRGSEHYDFGPHVEGGDRLIAEIRQYWTFDLEHPSSELVDYPYGEPGRLGR
ncbi:MAG: nuclear transport factor 2 family protein [Acidimicrobiaceae bacterium]|nr:nuclear transport factor 2 family protein [Acidimicrobiaceae bacterium]